MATREELNAEIDDANRQIAALMARRDEAGRELGPLRQQEHLYARTVDGDRHGVWVRPFVADNPHWKAWLDATAMLLKQRHLSHVLVVYTDQHRVEERYAAHEYRLLTDEAAKAPDRETRREALDRLAIESQEMGLPY